MAGPNDPFKTLGVPIDAGTQDIKKAFREKALNLHPDRFTTESEKIRAECATRFKAITEAYEILSNDQQRALYKSRLRGRDGGSTSSRSNTGFDGSYDHTSSSSGNWRRAWSSGMKSSRQNRLELLIIVGVTVVGFAGVHLADYLWGRGQTHDKASSFAATKSPLVKTYLGPGCGQRAALTTSTEAQAVANMPLSELLALEGYLAEEMSNEPPKA